MPTTNQLTTEIRKCLGSSRNPFSARRSHCQSPKSRFELSTKGGSSSWTISGADTSSNTKHAEYHTNQALSLRTELTDTFRHITDEHAASYADKTKAMQSKISTLEQGHLNDKHTTMRIYDSQVDRSFTDEPAASLKVEITSTRSKVPPVKRPDTLNVLGRFVMG